jgi:hypothetical protein
MQTTHALIIGVLAPLALNAGVLEQTIWADGVSANDNGIPNIRNELAVLVPQSKEVRSQPLLRLEPFTSDGAKLGLSSADLKEEDLKKTFDACVRYVALRIEGHSASYALFITLHGRDPWPESLTAVRADLRDSAADVAFPWLRRNLTEIVAFPLIVKTPKHNVAFIVDGELGWAYLLPKAGEGQPIVYRFDAIECMPGVRAIFMEESEKLKEKGIAPSLQWWNGLYEAVLVRSGIKWRIPPDVNPQHFFD